MLRSSVAELAYKGRQKGLAFGRYWSAIVISLGAKDAPRSRPAGLIADAGLRWCDGDAVMSRMEDLNVKVCQEVCKITIVCEGGKV
jgi:hypothetical protein